MECDKIAMLILLTLQMKQVTINESLPYINHLLLVLEMAVFLCQTIDHQQKEFLRMLMASILILRI